MAQSCQRPWTGVAGATGCYLFHHGEGGPVDQMYTRNRRRPGIPMQSAVSSQDQETAEKRYACSKCRITYEVPRRAKVQCPLCDATRRIRELQMTMTAMRNQLELTSDAAASLQMIVDVQLAMRRALDVINAEDLIFLKSILYRFRDDRTSIRLEVLRRRPGMTPSVIGFRALAKAGDQETHVCSSVGGVALAGYFDEVVRSAGSAEALTVLIRALNQCLTGGQRD